MRQIFLTAFISYVVLLNMICPALAQSIGGNNLFSNNGFTPNNANNGPPRQMIPLDDGPANAQSNWVPATFAAFPSRYLSLPGLNDAEKTILSENYFVVTNDSNIKSFAQLYNENRLDGISSYVTADSIVHPLFALQNSIRSKVVERSLSPLVEALLISMIRNNELDYQETEDAEVKEEIKFNLSFLTVAVKLLLPDFPLPGNAGIRQLVIEELNNIKRGKLTRSVLFNRLQDYSLCKPIGFYKISSATERFYSCYQWLAGSFLELSDTRSDSTNGNGNEFRRAILLFQSLAKAKIRLNNSEKSEPGMTIWKQITQLVQDLGINSTNKNLDQDIFLLPDNLARALSSATASEVSVSALSNPLNRTRLLLTIRSNAPRQFSSTSIFSLSRKDATKEKQSKFHLFMPLYSPEQDIHFSGPFFQRENSTSFTYLPVALLLLQNNGVYWANKILAKNSSKIDEGILNQIAEKQNSANAYEVPLSQFWKNFNGFSNACPEQTQLFMQTENWRTFCLERQTAAWIDSFVASKLNQSPSSPPTEHIAQKVSADATPSINGNTSRVSISSTIHKFGITTWRTNSNFNYLEPALDLYSKLAANQSNLENSLNQAGLFPAEYLQESHDFIRLLKRLVSIAKLELNLDFPKEEDQALLGTIDKLLGVVDSPLPGKLFIRFPSSAPHSNAENPEIRLTGANMEITQPASVFAIIQYRRAYYLLRGASYSYAEQCGEEINEKHWQRQVEFGFLDTPFWCQTFQKNSATKIESVNK